MNVLILTIFVGAILVLFFVVLFLYQQFKAVPGSLEHEALLPLEEEKSTAATPRNNTRKKANL